jgi:hypothetical protein
LLNNEGDNYLQISSITISQSGYLFAGTWIRSILKFGQKITNVANGGKLIPSEFSLQQNYPNPFNPTTTINYSIPKSGFVKIKVYDLLGRIVTTLVNENKLVGNYSVQLNASKLTSGVYFYRMESGSFSQTKKLLLLK